MVAPDRSGRTGEYSVTAGRRGGCVTVDGTVAAVVVLCFSTTREAADKEDAVCKASDKADSMTPKTSRTKTMPKRRRDRRKIASARRASGEGGFMPSFRYQSYSYKWGLSERRMAGCCRHYYCTAVVAVVPVVVTLW
jgi:hypothetical protein